MKFLSKLFIMGLLFVTLPTFARNCEHKKCSIIGTFIGTYVEGSPTVMQFHEDGTVQFAVSNTPYFGTWRCLGNNCFAFCGVTEKTRFADSPDISKFAGKLCFNADCKTAHADRVTFTLYASTDTCLETPVQEVELVLNICRVDCCE